MRRKIATQNRKIYYSKQLLGDKLKNTILKIKTIKIKKNKEVTFVQFHSIAISIEFFLQYNYRHLFILFISIICFAESGYISILRKKLIIIESHNTYSSLIKKSEI